MSDGASLRFTVSVLFDLLDTENNQRKDGDREGRHGPQNKRNYRSLLA